MKVNIVFDIISDTAKNIELTTSRGAIHKVCHAIFDDFWPLSPLSRTVILSQTPSSLERDVLYAPNLFRLKCAPFPLGHSDFHSVA